ncbi:unnamed protein product [Rhizophagus irregularis]|nr:unnamed protein product [Rhizophagus irregularis]
MTLVMTFRNNTFNPTSIKKSLIYKISISERTNETYTDTLVDDLLRIVGLNTFPLVIRNHQVCRLFIGGHVHDCCGG